MVNSINNNPAATAGVHQLRKTDKELERTTEKVATGKKVSVNAQDLSSNGLGLGGASVSTPANAQNAVAAIDNAISGASKALASFGSAAKSIERQTTANTQMSDSLKQGLGNLVDTNLGE